MKIGCSDNCSCKTQKEISVSVPRFIGGRTTRVRRGTLLGATTLEELFPIDETGKRSFNLSVRLDLTSAMYLGGAIMAGTLLSNLLTKAIK